MIIEIPNENSIVKWKNDEKDEWKVAEISDLIKAYESPKVTVFAENASKEEIEDFKQELEKVLEEKPHSEWIDEGQYAEGHDEHAYVCKKCGYQIIENPDMIYENRFCKYCGADMRGTTNGIKR